MEAKPDFTFHKVKIKCVKATKIKEILFFLLTGWNKEHAQVS